MDSMVKKAEVLAIIPARGGSKGIPRKNIRNFAGYPLLAYSIAAAKQSQQVTRVVVSTDDEEIAAVAREYGAEVPFLRPAELAQDDSTDFPLFTQALDWFKHPENSQPYAVVQLRPTSPVRPRGCVDEALTLLLNDPNADCVRGVVPAGQNPHKMWRIGDDQRMMPLLQVEGIAEPYNAPRQALPPVYWQTGHIDAIRTSCIMQKQSLTGDVILPLLIDPRFTVDIDNLWDWTRAEYLVRNGGLDMISPGKPPRPYPDAISLVALDFDGVLTDNRVWVTQEGAESVAANRSDSMGINLARKMGFEFLVISTEVNPVVAARCRKTKLPYYQGIDDKLTMLKSVVAERQLDPAEVIFVGNDVNDLPCFPYVGCSVAPADAQPEVLRLADQVLTMKAGHGAVRELCDLLMRSYRRESETSNRMVQIL